MQNLDAWEIPKILAIIGGLVALVFSFMKYVEYLVDKKLKSSETIDKKDGHSIPAHTGDQMKIYEIPISQAQLDSFPANERLFFIQIGHLANELSTLNRLLLFVSNSSCTTNLETRAKNSQTLLLIRLCCGKLFEGWQMLQRDYFGSKISIEYDDLLDRSGQKSLAEIKRYFSKNNLIKDIRDNFAFHYSSDELKAKIPIIEGTDPLYIYLGYSHGNSFYYFADVIVGSAMMSKVPGADAQQAMNTLFADPISAIKWFLDFIGSCMIVLVEKYLGTTLEALEANTIEIQNPKKLKDVQLPFFLEE